MRNKKRLTKGVNQQLQEFINLQGAVLTDKVKIDSYRLGFHIMPPYGFLNDPNGLCQFQGVYHIFYQFCPWDAQGNTSKAWAHLTSDDFIHWKQQKIAIMPDTIADQDGAYSGSCCIYQNNMYLYYTGNVKKSGEHDYITTGREANTIVIESKDGNDFEHKELLLVNEDYPDDYTCHVRDPKVWLENNRFFMVQGGRKISDKGAVILFSSKDPYRFEVIKEITTSDVFGYMWECPDYFTIDGKNYLAVCPQGVEKENFRFQNKYQAGYFSVREEILKQSTEIVIIENNFIEWDMGFDFYAPQTFLDESGRRILIGWVGMPDAEYHYDPIIEAGWNHSLTLPRELTINTQKEGQRLLQYPIKEILHLRKEENHFYQLWESEETRSIQLSAPLYELHLEKEAGEVGCITISCEKEWLTICHEDGAIVLKISKMAGYGRGVRRAKKSQISEVDIFMDRSVIEIYINKGELVFTSKFYFPSEDRKIELLGFHKIEGWELEATINYSE